MINGMLLSLISLLSGGFNIKVTLLFIHVKFSIRFYGYFLPELVGRTFLVENSGPLELVLISGWEFGWKMVF